MSREQIAAIREMSTPAGKYGVVQYSKWLHEVLDTLEAVYDRRALDAGELNNARQICRGIQADAVEARDTDDYPGYALARIEKAAAEIETLLAAQVARINVEES